MYTKDVIHQLYFDPELLLNFKLTIMGITPLAALFCTVNHSAVPSSDTCKVPLLT